MKYILLTTMTILLSGCMIPDYDRRMENIKIYKAEQEIRKFEAKKRFCAEASVIGLSDFEDCMANEGV